MPNNTPLQNLQVFSLDYCIETIASTLKQKGLLIRNSKGGYDRLSCPVCGSSDSLSMNPGDNGKILFHCFSNNCAYDRIVHAIRERGLPFPSATSRHSFTAAERAEMETSAAQKKYERAIEEAARHAQAAQEATRIFEAASPMDEPTTYLRNKCFTGDLFAQLRQASDIRRDGDSAIIGLYDEDGKLSTLQTLLPNGEKRLLPGGKKKGAFHPIGITIAEVRTRQFPQSICLAEGWATAAAVFLATGSPVVAAVDVGNLLEVALIIRKLAPIADIIICADDDAVPDKPCNPGIKGAEKAACAVGGRVAYPRPELAAEGRKVDFWDVWHEAGPEAICRAVEAARAPASDVPPEGAKEDSGNETKAVHPGTDDNEKESAAFEKELDQLASLPLLAYERQKQDAAKRFGLPVTRLDKLMKERKTKRTAAPPVEALPFEETDPWPDPVNPAELLDEIERTIGRFIICDPYVCTAATLWVTFTWFIDVVRVAPMALITAPEMACGKSRFLDVLGRLSRRSMQTSSITPAALFRSLAMWELTLMIDEADAFMRGNEELRGVINSGHTRGSAFVIRTVGDEHTPTLFSTWGAKAIAGIRANKLARTITDRSIVLPLRRKLNTEKTESLHDRANRELFPLLRRKLARFAKDAAEIVEQADVPAPKTLSDRQKDNWEPLLAVAHAAGGDWPAKAKKAALELCCVHDEPVSVGVEMLMNLQTIFQEQQLYSLDGSDKFATAFLLQNLCENEEWRWATYRRGLPMTPRQMASILRGYGIRPKNLNLGGNKRLKGYLKADFDDAFARYLPVSASSPPMLSATQLASNDSNGLYGKSSATHEKKVAEETCRNSLKSQESSGVADKRTPTGEKSENRGESCRIF